MGKQEFYFDHLYLNKNSITKEECFGSLSDKELILISLEVKEQERLHLKKFLNVLEDIEDTVFCIPNHPAGLSHWKKFLHYKSLTEVFEKEKEKRRSL
jgi:hypothetical protein